MSFIYTVVGIAYSIFYFVVWVILVACTLGMFVAYIGSVRKEKYFEKNAIVTYAKALYSKKNTRGKIIAECVLLVDNFDGEVRVMSKRFYSLSDIPNGEMVKVAYIKERLFGGLIEKYKLRIIDEKYAKPSLISKKSVFGVLTLAFLAMSIAWIM